MNTRNFFKTVVATFSTELGIHFLSFLTTIYIVRNLSTTDFGIFSLLISFSITLCYLSFLGLPQAIIFFIGKQKYPFKKLISTYLFLSCCIGFAVSVIGYLIRDYPLNNFLKELPGHYFIPLLIIYFFFFLDAFLLSIIRGLKNFFLFNLRRFLTPAFNLFGVLVAFLVFGPTLKSLVIVYTVVCVTLTAWFFIKVRSITSFKFHSDWGITKSLLGYGAKSYLQILAGHLIYQVDLYILAYFLGADEVAFYAIAVGIATLLWYIPNTVGTVLFPTLSSVQDEKEIHLFSAMICRHTLFITSLAAICLGLIGKYLILFFYGAEYVKSVNAMLIILPGIVVMSIYKVLTRNFSSRNRQQVSIMAACIALLVNLCLNFLWIPRFGIEGAALASTVSYTVAGVILLVMVKMESNIPIMKMLIVDTSDLKAYKETFSKLHKKYLKSKNPI